jgi:hypothetical protein
MKGDVTTGFAIQQVLQLYVSQNSFRWHNFVAIVLQHFEIKTSFAINYSYTRYSKHCYVTVSSMYIDMQWFYLSNLYNMV